MKKVGKIRSVMVSAAIFAAILAGCGNKESVSPDKNGDIDGETVQESVAGSVTDEAAEEGISDIEETEEDSTEEATVEEAQVEEDTSNLSNEEWVRSLNLQTGTYLIFNDTTGERKVLEDGQEYTLLEGDELAFWGPLDWRIRNRRTNLSYESELKYDCLLMHFNHDEIGERTELIIDVEDLDGNEIPFTVYLSK